ncbi:MAG TPA: hypothetical protein VJ576_04440 [Rhodocyclaceae bacterium]|nr:hypothetical protein [Rhodocyclaceae bacterium]
MLLAHLPLPLLNRSRLAALVAGMAVFVSAAGAQTVAELKVSDARPVSVETAGSADNEQLEKALQSLPWEQFRAVVEAIPKLKADVDAYGPLGWQYVQANYRTYPWRKNIKKLHEPQKKHLAELIDQAREGARPSN